MNMFGLGSVTIAFHSSPVAVALLTLRTNPLVEAIVISAGVAVALAAIIDPLALRIVFWIKLDVSGATRSQDEPLYTFIAFTTELK
jgi:hypothetical protein